MEARVDPARYEAAFRLALEAHAGQMRKATRIPYISHPMGVAALVLEDGGSDDEALAALLHDAVEDGGQEYIAEIEDTVGGSVASIVVECSDSVVPAGAERPPWEERKRAYVDAIPGKSPGAVRVTTADKLHNARAIVADLREAGPDVFARFNGGREGTLWYYDAVSEALASHPAARPRLMAELARTVEEMHRLAARDT
jgi:(p)ppGpp synthase/HD superfamily hydrolase